MVFLFTVADIGSGLASLALVAGLYFGIAPAGRSYVGLFLLGLYGVAELLSGIFPIDVGGEATTAGTIHKHHRQHSVLLLPYRRDPPVFTHGQRRAVAVFPAPRSCVVNCGRNNRHIDDSRLELRHRIWGDSEGR